MYTLKRNVGAHAKATQRGLCATSAVTRLWLNLDLPGGHRLYCPRCDSRPGCPDTKPRRRYHRPRHSPRHPARKMAAAEVTSPTTTGACAVPPGRLHRRRRASVASVPTPASVGSLVCPLCTRRRHHRSPGGLVVSGASLATCVGRDSSGEDEEAYTELQVVYMGIHISGRTITTGK